MQDLSRKERKGKKRNSRIVKGNITVPPTDTNGKKYY